MSLSFKKWKWLVKIDCDGIFFIPRQSKWPTMKKSSATSVQRPLQCHRNSRIVGLHWPRRAYVPSAGGGESDLGLSCRWRWYLETPVLISPLSPVSRLILRPQDVILSPDAKGVMKEFCSQNCLTSFNFKKNGGNVRQPVAKTVAPPSAPQSICSVCLSYCIVSLD